MENSKLKRIGGGKKGEEDEDAAQRGSERRKDGREWKSNKRAGAATLLFQSISMTLPRFVVH